MDKQYLKDNLIARGRSEDTINLKNWLQHTNPDGTPGGWVENTATVAATAFLDSAAIVAEHARVLGTARVENMAYVHGNARVDGDATISSKAIIEGDAHIDQSARIQQSARIGGHAYVTGNARVGWKAVVDGNATIKGGAYIANDAHVTGHAVVSGEAQVISNAKVFDYAQISGAAIVDDNAQIFGMAKVGGTCSINGKAQITGNSEISGVGGTVGVSVSDDVIVRDDASIIGDNIVLKGLTIVGAGVKITNQDDLKEIERGNVQVPQQQAHARIFGDVGHKSTRRPDLASLRVEDSQRLLKAKEPGAGNSDMKLAVAAVATKSTTEHSLQLTASATPVSAKPRSTKRPTASISG